jgi:hypothetical protein
VPERSKADLLLELADDELLLGWQQLGVDRHRAVPRGRTSRSRRSRRTRSGRACALRARRPRARHRRRRPGLRPPARGSTARPPRRAAPLEWARTIARHWLYETADAIRLEALRASDDPELAGIAAKIDREEVYHRIHAEMWVDRLLGSDEGRPRLDEALERALAVRPRRARRGASTRARAAVEAKLGRPMPTPSRSHGGRTRRSSPSCSTR